MELHKLHKQRMSIWVHPSSSGLLLTIALMSLPILPDQNDSISQCSPPPHWNLCPVSSEWVWLAHKRSQTMSLKKSPGAPRDAWVMGPGPTLYTAAFGLVSNTPLSPLQKAQGKQWCWEKAESAGDCVRHKRLLPHPLWPWGGGLRRVTQGSVCRGDSCHVPCFQGTVTQQSAKCEPFWSSLMIFSPSLKCRWEAADGLMES